MIPNIDIVALIQRLAVAVLVGLLVGLERLHSNRYEDDKSFGSVRTYTIVSVFGFVSALIASCISVYLYAAFFLGFSVILSISFYFKCKNGEYGGTSDLTFLMIFLIGSLLYWDAVLIAVIIAVILISFLSLKKELHEFAGKIGAEDIFATLKFAIVSIIILPLLPDKEIGPYNVINPHNLWYVVVLIAGISFVGYILFKLFGADRGIKLLSVLGGLVSSTATTLSFTEKSRSGPSLNKNFAAAIVLASTIMFPRVLLIVYIINAPLGILLLKPVMILLAVGVATSLFLWRGAETGESNDIKISNPFKIMTAIKFGLIFAVIFFISKISLVFLGNRGVYITSFIGGLADVDAVALSMSKLSGTGLVEKAAGVSVIIAMLSNSIFKMMVTVFMGDKGLKKYTVPGFMPIILVCVLSLLYILKS